MLGWVLRDTSSAGYQGIRINWGAAVKIPTQEDRISGNKATVQYFSFKGDEVSVDSRVSQRCRAGPKSLFDLPWYKTPLGPTVNRISRRMLYVQVLLNFVPVVCNFMQDIFHFIPE